MRGQLTRDEDRRISLVTHAIEVVRTVNSPAMNPSRREALGASTETTFTSGSLL